MSHFWNIMFEIHPKRRRMQNDFFVQGIFILGCYHQKNNVSSSSRFNDVVRFLSTFACVSLSHMEITWKVKSIFEEAWIFFFHFIFAEHGYKMCCFQRQYLPYKGFMGLLMTWAFSRLVYLIKGNMQADTSTRFIQEILSRNYIKKISRMLSSKFWSQKAISDFRVKSHHQEQ